MTVWNRIWEQMKQQNVSAAELARRTGIKPSSITGWKKGEYEPSSDSVIKISEALDVPLDVFYSQTQGGITEETPNYHLLSKSEAKLVNRLRSVDPMVRAAVLRLANVALDMNLSIRMTSTDSPSFLSVNDDMIRRNDEKESEYGIKRVEGSAAAGAPITAVPDADMVASVPLKYMSDNYFLVRAKGDSMIDAGINDGDVCIFQKDGYQDEGKIMLVQVEGDGEEPDVTIKRVYVHGHETELQPANPDYEPMFYSTSSVQIMGVLALVVPPDA